MTKENAKDFLTIVQALAEGKTIQVLQDNTWFTLNNNVNFSLSLQPNQYRIKPFEPSKPKDIWVNEYEDDRWCCFLTQEKALNEKCHLITRRAVHYREVIEE